MTKNEKIKNVVFSCGTYDDCKDCPVNKNKNLRTICEQFEDLTQIPENDIDKLLECFESRKEKLDALSGYCNMQVACSDCGIFPFKFCENNLFTDLTDEQLDVCLKAIRANNTPVIKDSGNRRKFDTGAVRDMPDGKGRMDLLPWAAIMEVSKHCEAGAKKYGEHNVDKGIPTNSLCDSAARHLAKYLDGWTDENHLLAAAWNLLWAIEMTLKKPEMVNTPWGLQK